MWPEWTPRCGHPEPETRKLQDKGFLLTSDEDNHHWAVTGSCSWMTLVWPAAAVEMNAAHRAAL